MQRSPAPWQAGRWVVPRHTAELWRRSQRPPTRSTKGPRRGMRAAIRTVEAPLRSTQDRVLRKSDEQPRHLRAQAVCEDHRRGLVSLFRDRRVSGIRRARHHVGGMRARDWGASSSSPANWVCESRVRWSLWRDQTAAGRVTRPRRECRVRSFARRHSDGRILLAHQQPQ